ncbi:MAG: LapA family protein [Betaproteobacteria bacterium]|nr:LapA family protein [Betaproteobacteria bacterium]
MQLAVIIGILVALASVLFAMQNSTPVTVVFLVWRFDGSLAMIILVSIALGALAVALVSMPAALRSRWTISRQRRDMEALRASAASPRPREGEPERRSSGPDERTDSNRHPGEAR